jgi:hypothetical protein
MNPTWEMIEKGIRALHANFYDGDEYIDEAAREEIASIVLSAALAVDVAETITDTVADVAKRVRPVVWCDDHEPVGWECGCDQAYDAVETVTIRRVAD